MKVLSELYCDDHGRHRPPLAEVWLPDGPGPHPPVLVTHGGGFILGHRRMSAVRHTALHLVSQGFAVASFDYRLAFRGGRLREGIEDVIAGMTWWRANAERFHLDEAKMALVGVSAGSALMMLAAEQLGPVAKVVSIHGPMDWRLVPGGGLTLTQRLLFQHSDSDQWMQQSPMNFELDVPLLVQTGTADRLVVPENAKRLEARRRERGLPIETKWYEAGHGWLRKRDHPEFGRAMADLSDFLAA